MQKTKCVALLLPVYECIADLSDCVYDSVYNHNPVTLCVANFCYPLGYQGNLRHFDDIGLVSSFQERNPLSGLLLPLLLLGLLRGLLFCHVLLLCFLLPLRLLLHAL